MAPIFPEFLLIDYRPQEDLMFWDQLTRSLARAERTGRWIGLIVGCAEQAERLLLQSGLSSTRTKSEQFEIPEGVSEALERVLFEDKRKLSTRFTDEGVAAVGMMAFDQGLVRLRKDEIALRDSFAERLWQAPAVLPVMVSVCKDEQGALHDIHPVRLGMALDATLSVPASFSILSTRGETSAKQGLSDLTQHQLEGLVRDNVLSNWVFRIPNLSNWKMCGPNF